MSGMRNIWQYHLAGIRERYECGSRGGCRGQQSFPQTSGLDAFIFDVCLDEQGEFSESVDVLYTHKGFPQAPRPGAV